MKPFLQTMIVLYLLACFAPSNAQGIDGEVLAAADTDTTQEGDKKKDDKKKGDKKKDGKKTGGSDEEPDCD